MFEVQYQWGKPVEITLDGERVLDLVPTETTQQNAEKIVGILTEGRYGINRTQIDTHIELVERTTNQCGKLLEYLKRGYSINLIEAGEFLQIRALSQRVGELRRGKFDGTCYDIRDVWENKIKRYYLSKGAHL